MNLESRITRLGSLPIESYFDTHVTDNHNEPLNSPPTDPLWKPNVWSTITQSHCLFDHLTIPISLGWYQNHEYN